MASQVDPTVIVPLQTNGTDRADPPSMAALMQFEADIRRQASVSELTYLVANESRRVCHYDQLFVLRRSKMGEGFHVICISSIAMVDRNAPLVQAIEALVGAYNNLAEPASLYDCNVSEHAEDAAWDEYPFHKLHWQPLLDRTGQVFAGLLLARSMEFTAPEKLRLERVAETTAHSWLALTGNRPVSRLPKFDRKKQLLLGALLVAGALFPVRMTVLAPVEVVAAKPFVVSAPYAGVIQRMDVAPNAMVQIGQAVLTFEDIKVRNELQQATERVSVARAKLERATSASFADTEQASEISALKAEFDLARSDYAYARELMGKSKVLAPEAGMAIFSDKRDWEGRAVNVGDPIMQIADPTNISYRVEMPAKEQMALEVGAPVKIWLDAQPLWSLSASVESASFQARPTADGILAFAVNAKPEGEKPRIGSRGTAKLYGQRVPFIYMLLRRPIGSLRQFLGL